ncbi:MAG: type II toxin-antitoxin system Phd/YefM family antitoxin [Bryobacteraceae bacterium]
MKFPLGSSRRNASSRSMKYSKSGGEIVITKRGKPVARLAPPMEDIPDIFGRMKGTGEILGDIVGPTGEAWNADKDTDD